MSRKLFAFLLSELKTVRLICQNAKCGSVTELSVERLRLAESKCPVCRHEFVPNTGAVNELNRLAVAIDDLQRRPGVQIEFVLPDNG